MASYFDISLIGAGNVATHLAPQLENAGHTVHEIYSRKITHAELLVSKLYSAEAVNVLDFTESDARVFIIAVPDEHIESVASKVDLPMDAMLVHTSGTVAMSTLGYAHEEIGVFYPLQTFSIGKKVDFEEIPICVEAGNSSGRQTLRALAKSLSKHVYEIDSENRKVLHLAAVFACNFSNHMHAIAEDILESSNLPGDILTPLIYETVQKSLEMGAGNTQTGPAMRGDTGTINEHLELLSENHELSELYKLITDHILNKYS